MLEVGFPTFYSQQLCIDIFERHRKNRSQVFKRDLLRDL